jgi:hypothetical protein
MSYRGRNAHASLEKYSSSKPALENRLVKVGPHSRIRYVTVRPASVPPLGQRSSGRMGDRYFGVLAPLTVKSPPRRLNESIDCTGMCFMANALARKATPPAYWRSAQAVGAFALAIGALTLARLAIRRGNRGQHRRLTQARRLGTETTPRQRASDFRFPGDSGGSWMGDPVNLSIRKMEGTFIPSEFCMSAYCLTRNVLIMIA